MLFQNRFFLLFFGIAFAKDMTVSDFWETGVRGGKWCFSLQWHMHDWELEACIHEVSLYGEGEDKLWWKVRNRDRLQVKSK